MRVVENSHQKGRFFEERALAFLQKRGFRLIKRNFRCKLGEIDLIVEKADCLVFVEVRSRKTTTFLHPLESIHKEKVRRLINAAEMYLANYRPRQSQYRFDIVTVVNTEKQAVEIDHIEDAFDKGF